MKRCVAVALFLGSIGVVAGCSPEDHPVAPSAGPDSVARYTVTFAASWSATSHPQEFPGSAHFSGLIGATHDDRAVFWMPGALASPGIQDMAELGSKTPLDTEVSAAITAGTAKDTLSGGVVSRSPGSVALDFEIALSHPRVTLVTMIAPSPDWFVGVSGLSLLATGDWVDSLVVELRGWDAGTDDGATYIAMNAPSMPHVPIAPLEDGPFLVNGDVPILGTFTFVRR
jgi:Spondin_N